jgi:hypothetical protein
MKLQTALIGIVGIVVGLALAFCFFRVTAVAFQIVSFAFWLALGIIVVWVVYSAVLRRGSR